MEKKSLIKIKQFDRKYKVNIKTGCMEWQGRLDFAGYGNIHVFYGLIDGKPKTRNFRAHKLSLFLHNKISLKEVLSKKPCHHKCFNRSCVNPNHLVLVTLKKNAEERAQRQNRQTHCVNGHIYTEENTRFTCGRRCCVKCYDVGIIKHEQKYPGGYKKKYVRTNNRQQLKRLYPSFDLEHFFFSKCEQVSSIVQFPESELKPLVIKSRIINPPKLKIDKKTNCWNYEGFIDRAGYAHYSANLGKFNGKNIYFKSSAHRWSLIFYKNYTLDEMKGYHCHHKCNNRSCVNPDHLVLKTIKEHAEETGRKLTHCKRGHEFTTENTRIVHGIRSCWKCSRSNHKKWLKTLPKNYCQKVWRRGGHRRKLRKIFPSFKISGLHFGEMEIKKILLKSL